MTIYLKKKIDDNLSQENYEKLLIYLLMKIMKI